MLTLVTSNPAKYAPFGRELERLRLGLETPQQPLLEVQAPDFAGALAAKARAAAEGFGRPVLVDDAGLVLEAYRPFPGPHTSAVLRGLGPAGLRRLLCGVSDRAAMECHLGCWVDGALRSWSGAVPGRLDFSRSPRDERMPLSDLFVPDGAADGAGLRHRARALAALERDAFQLHLDTAAEPSPETAAGADRPVYLCEFCIEFSRRGADIFANTMGDRLKSRIVYEDEHFVLMPPLGEFIEGGLLLLTREHLLSFAHLPPDRFAHLERLLAAIGRALNERWGSPPLVFEHGPSPAKSKGGCCVDHAHLNLFPARVPVHPRLADRMHLTLGGLAELRRLRAADCGYLFVQENDGTRRAYDGKDVPTQLVRRIITTGLGMPERWHWRDYLGCDELVATYHALKGQIRL